MGCLLNTVVGNNVLDSLLRGKSKCVGVKTNFFQATTTEYKEGLFRYLRSFPYRRAEEGFTLELVQNGWNGQQGSVLWRP